MKVHSFFTIAASFLVMVSCSGKVDPDTPGKKPVSDTKLEAPSAVTAAQVNSNSVMVSWTDNSADETSFSVVYKKDGSAIPTNAGMVKADSTSIVVSGLKLGNKYYFGVKANSKIKESLSSDFAYTAEAVEIQDMDPANIEFTENPSATYASISVRYEAKDFENEIKEKGICWGEAENPTVEGAHIAASKYVDGAQLQAIPNAVLEEGKTYHIRAYAKTEGKTYYSSDKTAALAPQPEAITFTWTDITPSGYPAEVKVYKTTSTIEGSPINAWYAIADLSTGKVALKANSPGTTKTLDAQWTSDCLVMINGAYFYNTSAVGLSVINSSLKTSLYTVRGSLRTNKEYNIANEYNTMYPVTRGCFGIDAQGNAKTLWCYDRYYYDAPLPHVIGDQCYDVPTQSWNAHKVSWNPVYALGAGPVLLYDNKVQCDYAVSGRGLEYYINNWEVIPYDIYNDGESPDRTAIGCTADGKVIFFICDGRIKASAGAELDEMGRIMKGLGCVDACNMDGGGSTNMFVNGSRVNYADENRPVATTWGFYKVR